MLSTVWTASASKARRGDTFCIPFHSLNARRPAISEGLQLVTMIGPGSLFLKVCVDEGRLDFLRIGNGTEERRDIELTLLLV